MCLGIPPSSGCGQHGPKHDPFQNRHKSFYSPATEKREASYHLFVNDSTCSKVLCVLYRRTAANQNLHRLRSNDVVVELGFAATVDFLPKVVHGEPVS